MGRERPSSRKSARVAAWLALAIAAFLAANLLIAPAAEADSPPASVSNITITRSDGALTASWDAPSGATSYHITYSSDGAHSWSLGAFGHTSTSLTISNVVNSYSYIVAVRAKNAAGWSGWTNSAAAGPHTPTTPQPSPPAAPSSVTVTRGEGVLHASWPAVSGATSYHVTYSYVFDDRGGVRKWWAAATNHASSSITIPHVWNGEQYVVGVRARNSSGDSGWTNSPKSPIYFSNIGLPDPPASVTVTRTNGSISATWPAAAKAQSYHIATSTDGGDTYHLYAVDYTETSITIDAHNNLVYIVAVESVNGNGLSPITYSASSPPYIPLRPSWVQVARGDGTLTATWPPASGATSYHVTYSADGGVSWTLGAYGHTSTSLEISGADNAASYIVGVRALNANGSSPWRNSPSAAPWVAPPAAPANLAVAPGAGFLGITWDAAARATSYDIRAKSEGASNWHSVATGVTATSWNYSTTTTMDYVAVRARNASGTSAWAEVSRLPSSEMLSTAQGISGSGGLQMAAAMSGEKESGASGQSNNQVSGQSKLGRPIWGTIDRTVNRGFKADIDLNWTHQGWATGFNLACSDTDGWTWNTCGWLDNSERVQYTSVPTARSRPVTVTHYRRGSDSRHTAGDYRLMHSRHYTIAIRAVNANPSQASDWVSTQILRPIFPVLRDFTWTRTDNQITLSWTPAPWTTGYKVYCDTYTSGGTYNPSYTLCATLTSQDDTATTHSVTITKSGGTHNWASLDNTSTLDIAIDSSNATGNARWLTPLMAAGKTLSTSNLTATGATLTLEGHTGGWWYKGGPRNGTYGTCTPVTGSTSVTLSTLTADQTYEYHAYSATGCADANLIATAIFRTLASGGGATIALTNITQTTARAELKNRTGAWWYRVDPRAGEAGTCTVGPSGFVVNLANLDAGAVYSFTAFSDATCSTEIKKVGFSTVAGPELTATSVTDTTATLNLANHTGDWWHQGGNRGGTLSACIKGSGTSADLTSLSPGSAHTYGAFSASSCATAVELDSVTFTTLATLTASNIGATTARLTISGHTAQWWYKANVAPHTSCQGPVAANTATKDLTGLTAGTAYTYTAYDATGCAAADVLSTTASFTTNVTAGNLSATTSGNIGVGVSFTSKYVAAQGFTAGSHTGGYTLTSIELAFSVTSGSPGDIVVTLRAADTSNSANPSTTVKATLSGPSTPTTEANSTYTCDATITGNNCDLTAGATYFVYAAAPNASSGGINTYSLKVTASNSETKEPSTNGWSIADTGRSGLVYLTNTSWSDVTNSETITIKVTAAPK